VNTTIVSREVIARQAAKAAETHMRTGEEAQNPYDANFEPEHHDEFAMRFYVALQRMRAPADSEASA
jgi:hypothetical protein